MSQTFNAAVSVVGIDIGKNSFHIVGHDERGAIVLRQKWSRGQVEARFANIPPCLVGMEARVGAHHLSRKLRALGHDARLMPAKYVRPYSKRQKNDFRDAEAIAEAVQRPTMKFVATKTADQLDLQALHERFFKEIHGSQLHRLDSKWNIAVTGHDHDRQQVAACLETFQKFNAVNIGQPHIGHHASKVDGGEGVEKISADSKSVTWKSAEPSRKSSKSRIASSTGPALRPKHHCPWGRST